LVFCFHHEKNDLEEYEVQTKYLPHYEISRIKPITDLQKPYKIEEVVARIADFFKSIRG